MWSKIAIGERLTMKTEYNYHFEGDYLIPDLIPPESPDIGIWGMRRKNYLINYKKPIYTGLLLSGELNAHLEEIDCSAGEMFEQLIQQHAAREGVTEQLKSQNQIEWVQRMNGIREQVEEIIHTELIFD